jgi:hypothetical protein
MYLKILQRMLLKRRSLGPSVQRAVESRMNFLFAQIMYLSNVLELLEPPGMAAPERSFSNYCWLIKEMRGKLVHQASSFEVA